jgi:hypothetical protein
MTPSKRRQLATDIDIVADYEAGLTIVAITEKNGVGHQSVFDALRRQNVTLRRDRKAQA